MNRKKPKPTPFTDPRCVFCGERINPEGINVYSKQRGTTKHLWAHPVCFEKAQRKETKQ